VTDRSTALQILAALQQSPVGDAGVLFSDAGAEGYATTAAQAERELTRCAATAASETWLRTQRACM
jgi:hypothetical protein